MRRIHVVAAAVMLVLTSTAAPAQSEMREPPARRVLSAQRVLSVAPVIDGILDDAAWQSAPIATDFVQRAPRPGQPATQQTEARVVYDNTAIYVAMRLYDSAPDSIAAQLARRDAASPFSDWAHVLIDSYADRRTGYRFSVNPAGVKWDVYYFDDQREDVGWDAVWDVAARIDEHGWTAEFRIPLSQLRFSPASSADAELRWGVQFGRTIARTDELSFWAPVAPSEPGFVSQAGQLIGLHGLGSPKRLELQPYAVSRLTRVPLTSEPDPFFRANTTASTFGADLKYGLSANLTLTGTINPDFGQVEADPAVVNLTAFETLLPERRPFFLEGANLISMQLGDLSSGEGLFYSRRIGRAPQRRAFGSAEHVDVPHAARILAAAKITGRTPGGWSGGFLTAVTEAAEARTSTAGAIETAAAEPLTNYAVGRLARDFRAGRSSISVLGTAIHRRIDDDALLFLRRSAYTGGVDWGHRFGRDLYQFSGFVAATSIHGDTIALRLAQRSPARYFQRPDASHVEFDPHRTSMQGMAGRFSVGRIAGSKTTGGVGSAFRTPGFEANDVGYQMNADQLIAFGWLGYDEFQAGSHLRRWNLGLNPNAGWNHEGTRLWTRVNAWGGATLHNLWSANVSLSHGFAAYSVTALRGGPALRRPGSNSGSFTLSGDRRKPVHLSAGSSAARDHDGQAWDWGAHASLTARPSARFDLTLRPSFALDHNGSQYVASPIARNADSTSTGRTEYVVGELVRHTFAMTTRLNYTLSPALSLQLYAQPYVTAGRFEAFRRVGNPRAAAFHARFESFAPEAVSLQGGSYRAQLQDGGYVQFSDPAFNTKQYRSNAVLRWEYRPGSTLFVAWSQSRDGFDPDGRFRFGRDLEGLFEAAPTNVFLVKLNYWFDL
jgi:hypothetical protein